MRSLVEHGKANNISVKICCDANAHHTIWGSSDTNHRGSPLAEYLATVNLNILNNGNSPTYENYQRGEVIDLTLASMNISEFVKNWRVSNEVTLSDHREITLSLHVISQGTSLVRNPKNTEWIKFNGLVKQKVENATWDANPRTCEDIDKSVDQLTSILHSSFTDSCIRRRKKEYSKSWWNKELNSLRKECRKLYRQYKGSRIEDREVQWERYKIKRNQYNYQIVAAKETSWKKFCESIEGAAGTARMHKFFFKTTGNKPGLLKKQNGDFSKTETESAHTLLDCHFPGNLRDGERHG